MILLLSIRFLDERYHGLTDNGESPEWPPSPFRLFQALIAGNTLRENIPETIAQALRWLETLDPPVIIAPYSRPGRTMLTYVLNNVQSHGRAPKTIRPTLLNGDRLLQYCWAFNDAQSDATEHATTIMDAARHIRALGWGIDLAIGHGELANNLPAAVGLRVAYRPGLIDSVGGLDLRTPRRGSLKSLCDCYADFLKRYESSGTINLESSGAIYQPWPYIVGAARPYEIFALRTDDDEFFRYPHAMLIHIAGMVRHTAIAAMQAYPPQDPEIKDPAAWVESFVAGHRPEGIADHKQFSYIPLPSIGHEHSDAMIRRVMIVAPIGHDAHLRHLADQLDGARLQPLDGSAVKVGPTLNRVARDNIARWYVGTADTWATVTPVILSGHDDHKPAKTEKLIRKALEQSGVDQTCEFTWSALPHYKNCLTAHKYDRRRGFVGYHRPGHLKEQTAIHVRLQFQRPVAGPLSIGAGRHCGLGVFCRFDC